MYQVRVPNAGNLCTAWKNPTNCVPVISRRNWGRHRGWGIRVGVLVPSDCCTPPPRSCPVEHFQGPCQCRRPHAGWNPASPQNPALSRALAVSGAHRVCMPDGSEPRIGWASSIRPRDPFEHRRGQCFDAVRTQGRGPGLLARPPFVSVVHLPAASASLREPRASTRWSSPSPRSHDPPRPGEPPPVPVSSRGPGEADRRLAADCW